MEKDLVIVLVIVVLIAYIASDFLGRDTED
jgi:hypothetical protein